MTWQERYANKIMTADEAVSHVQPGDKIIIGDWLAEPPVLVEALVNQHSRLKDVTIISGMSPGPEDYYDYPESFREVLTFCGPKARIAMKEGRADFIGGNTYHKWPEMFAVSAELNPHWAFIQVSKPDEHGNCSYGIDVSFTEPAVRTAEKVIAQINPNMPWTFGETISLNDIDYIVPAETPLYTIGRAEPSEKIQRIANYVAERVEDGSTIQLGIGALPDAIARNLTDKKHLGVHTEAMTEAMMELMQAGVIDGSMKTLNKGKVITCQIAGSNELYRFCDRNPDILVKPVDYTNNPAIIGQNYKQTSINACIEVDLKGQVNSETIDGHMYGGIGGQLDHVRGAQLSEGGASFITLNSTTKKDTISKIVPSLGKGSVVSVSRYDAQYIVTEYGVADLRYKSERERAKALIAIAHPDFRDELTYEARKMGLL